MEARAVSQVSVVPEHGRRAALFLPFTGDVSEALKIRTALVAAARAGGLEVKAVIDAKGGAKAARAEAALGACGGRIEVLVVNALRDLGDNLLDAVSTALDLLAVGTRLLSIREPWLKLDADLNLVTSIFAWLLTTENERRAQVIKAGQARARNRAPERQVGRPRKIIDLEWALALIAGGLPIAKAAQKIGCSRSHLKRALAAHEAVRPVLPIKSNWPPAGEDSPMTKQLLLVAEEPETFTHVEPHQEIP